MTDNLSIEEYNAIKHLPKEDQVDALWELRVSGSRPKVPAITKPDPQKKPKAFDDLYDFLIHGGYGQVWPEYQFHPKRKWKADFYLPDQQPCVIIEYDGINPVGDKGKAAHTSIQAVVNDSAKGNEAQALGLRFYRANAISLRDGSFYEFLDRVLERITDGG